MSKYNTFISSIKDETLRSLFKEATISIYNTFDNRNYTIFKIINNAPYSQIAKSDSLKVDMFGSLYAMILKFKDEDFLKDIDDKWELFLDTYKTQNEEILRRENEYIDKLEYENEFTDKKEGEEMDDDINVEMEQIEELKERQEMIMRVLLRNLHEMYPERYRF
jgi:lipopolysaccharide export LptBFGC system permease protein LptF